MTPPESTAELQILTTAAQCAELAQTLADVWGFAERSGVGAPDMLAALAFSGGYVAGVRVGGRLVGGGYGWPTRIGAEWRLQSHVIGFLPAFRALGLGAQIKYHQRSWAADSGLDAVEWTYDPLHAVNARFNLSKLGARVVGFYQNFYGPMADAFHTGLPSDRFLVRWGLDDGPRSLPNATGPLLVCGSDEMPIACATAVGIVTAEIPADIVELRRRDHHTAVAWSEAFARTVGPLVAAGCAVLGINDHREYLIETS